MKSQHTLLYCDDISVFNGFIFVVSIFSLLCLGMMSDINMKDCEGTEHVFLTQNTSKLLMKVMTERCSGVKILAHDTLYFSLCFSDFLYFSIVLLLFFSFLNL